MNSDYEFVRRFLLAVERKATDPVTALTREQLGFTDIPEGMYYRQIIHLERADLVETVYQRVDVVQRHLPGRLTEAGRQFLEKIRDDQVWQRMMSIQTGEMATFSLAVLIALADRITQINDKQSRDLAS
jgi:hypothetical protein